MKDHQKLAAIGMLSQVGEALHRTIGSQCEIVIHDKGNRNGAQGWGLHDFERFIVGPFRQDGR